MPTLLKPGPHLSLPEVEMQYKQASNGVEKIRFLIVKLLLEGKRCPEVAALVGFSIAYVRRVVHRYNVEGVAGLRDRRVSNGGNRSVLNAEQRQRLADLIEQGEPEDGGLWTSVKVQHWVEQETGKRISLVSAWKYLKRLGFSVLVPRPRHVKADQQAQTEVNKK